MNLDPRTSKRISHLGLVDLNKVKGWGVNFHTGFKDLNPELNPQYKFQRKKRAYLIADRYMTTLADKLKQQVEAKKFQDFTELVRKGHKFTTAELD